MDFGVAHLFETCNNAEQSLMNQLPENQRPLHKITRSQTGLLDNTAGTMYFYPPESTFEQAYNTYAADVVFSLSFPSLSFPLIISLPFIHNFPLIFSLPFSHFPHNQIWAVGVTLYVMVTGKLPIYNEDMLLFFDQLETQEIEYPDFLSPSLRYPFHLCSRTFLH